MPTAYINRISSPLGTAVSLEALMDDLTHPSGEALLFTAFPSGEALPSASTFTGPAQILILDFDSKVEATLGPDSQVTPYGESLWAEIEPCISPNWALAAPSPYGFRVVYSLTSPVSAADYPDYPAMESFCRFRAFQYPAGVRRYQHFGL